MAPSQLSIATSSLQRLVKEESSYHKELEQQEARLQKLESESGDENAEYMIKQEVSRDSKLLSKLTNTGCSKKPFKRRKDFSLSSRQRSKQQWKAWNRNL